MKKNILAILITLFSLHAAAQKVSQPRPGNPGSWRYLGTISAKTFGDHDVIFVKGPYDFFRKLKFKVTDSDIEINDILVRYDDGGAPERLVVRQNIPQGGESRVLDLRGGRRKLKSVEFWYRDKGFLNGKADVSLFGIK